MCIPTPQFILALVTTFISNKLLAQESESEFASLLCGKDLSGWEGDSKFWRVEDGAIVGQTTKDNLTPKNTFQ